MHFVIISNVYFYRYLWKLIHIYYRGHRGRDRMVIGFTTTYAISAYHH